MKNFSGLQLRILLFVLAVGFGSSTASFGHEEHGSHDPKFDGFVMMYIDLHFEVVLGERGGIRVYYSDAMREELPAAVVSAVHVDLLRKDAAPESVAMSVSDAGDYWEGKGNAVESRETIVRISFVFQDEPLVFELPAYVFPAFRHPDAEHAGHSA